MYVKHGAEIFDSLSNGPALRTYAQHSAAVCSIPEVDSHVISGRCMWLTVFDKCVQFRDPRCLTVLEIFDPKPSEAAFSTDFFLTSINVDRK